MGGGQIAAKFLGVRPQGERVRSGLGHRRVAFALEQRASEPLRVARRQLFGARSQRSARELLELGDGFVCSNLSL